MGKLKVENATWKEAVSEVLDHLNYNELSKNMKITKEVFDLDKYEFNVEKKEGEDHELLSLRVKNVDTRTWTSEGVNSSEFEFKRLMQSEFGSEEVKIKCDTDDLNDYDPSDEQKICKISTRSIPEFKEDDD